jgi:flagellar protein FlaG
MQREQQRLPATPLDRLAEAKAIVAPEAERKEKAARGEELPLTRSAQDTDEASMESAVSRITDFVQNFQRDLQFSIDKESDRMVVKVVDSKTQEVIRQIPSEETLRIAQNLDSSESLILREQA